MVSRRDRPPVADRTPRRPDDDGEPRDDLSIALRPGPWRAPTRAFPLFAQRTSGPSTAGSDGTRRRTYPRHGDDLRAADRGRGPGGAWSLGGRSHHGIEQPLRRRNPRRANHSLRGPIAPSRRSRGGQGQRGDARCRLLRTGRVQDRPTPSTERARFRWPGYRPPASRVTATSWPAGRDGSCEWTRRLL